mgnify:CR=1 FL=1
MRKAVIHGAQGNIYSIKFKELHIISILKNMDNISKLVGARIRGFRKEKHLSQEELAEKCNLHPTYIGQLERGEKNPTIESVMKISDGLQVPLDQLFANVTAANFPAMDYIPDKIMFLVMELTPKEQKIIYELILLALKLRN